MSFSLYHIITRVRTRKEKNKMKIIFIILISILGENKIKKNSKINFKLLSFILMSILSKKVLEALYRWIGREYYIFFFNIRLLFFIFILYLILREDNVYLFFI